MVVAEEELRTCKYPNDIPSTVANMSTDKQVKCRVCDTLNPLFRDKCLDCGTRLFKKSKPSQLSKKAKAKRKRTKLQVCVGNKNTYKTRNTASWARKKLQRDKGMALRIYWCGKCQGFHLTKYRS